MAILKPTEINGILTPFWKINKCIYYPDYNQTEVTYGCSKYKNSIQLYTETITIEGEWNIYDIEDYLIDHQLINGRKINIDEEIIPIINIEQEISNHPIQKTIKRKAIVSSYNLDIEHNLFTCIIYIKHFYPDDKPYTSLDVKINFLIDNYTPFMLPDGTEISEFQYYGSLINQGIPISNIIQGALLLGDSSTNNIINRKAYGI